MKILITLLSKNNRQTNDNNNSWGAGLSQIEHERVIGEQKSNIPPEKKNCNIHLYFLPCCARVFYIHYEIINFKMFIFFHNFHTCEMGQHPTINNTLLLLVTRQHSWYSYSWLCICLLDHSCSYYYHFNWVMDIADTTHFSLIVL